MVKVRGTRMELNFTIGFTCLFPKVNYITWIARSIAFLI